MNLSQILRKLASLGFLFLFSLFISNCSSSSSSDDEAENSLSNPISALTSEVFDQAAKLTGLLDAPASMMIKKDSMFIAPEFGTGWDSTATLPDNVTGSGNITAKEYMGNQLQENLQSDNGSDVNVFGRLKSGLGIFCALGVGAKAAGVEIDSRGYLDDGTVTITFTSEVKSAMTSICQMNVENIPDNTELSAVVTTASGDYDKKIHFDLFNQDYFVKVSDSEVNIANGEIQDNGAESRTIIKWDKTSGVIRVEYVSNPSSAPSGEAGVYGYRLYYDETADLGRMMVYEGGDSSLANSVRYILAGKPQTGDAFSLSLSSGYLESNAELEACVSSADGNILDDGARCADSSTRLNGAAVTDASTVFSNFYDDKALSGFGTVTTTTDLVWSSISDMLTEDFVP